MPTIVGRCPTSWFCSLFSVKESVEKVHSSSTKPKTCTMATILATLKYSNMVFFKTIELDNMHYNYVIGFTSYGGSFATTSHDCMVHLNVLAWRSSDDNDKIVKEIVPSLRSYLLKPFRKAICWGKFSSTFGWS